MAYNRWLSSQYSYSPGYDLMHYGRKGMRWGKHIFGLPEITLNGGGGGAVDLEELKKMLEQGKITLDEFKARAEKHFQSVAEVNKDGLKQVQDKFSEYMKKVQDTYENFKAGDGSNKEPKKEEYDVTAKQRKIYQTIGKFLNYALTITNPYHGTINGLKKTVKAIKR